MRRLLLFLLLLGLGFLVLQYSLGGEDFARATTPDRPVEPPSTQSPKPPESMHVQGRGQDIGVVLHGGMTIPRSRDVRVGNRIDHVMIYELVFLDSAAVGDGLQQLDGVTLKLFDRGLHAATLLAKTAFVELSRDSGGTPSLREDKEIELRQAVLDTLPDARLLPLHLEIDVVRLRVRDDEIELHTPTEQEPVLLVVQGEHPGRMSGRGLQARLPKDQGGQLRRIDLEILHDPLLTTEDIEVRAQGRMHYVEETERGSALITVDDHVRLRMLATVPLGGGAQSKAADIDVRGDHLSAWLGRQKQPPAADGKGRKRASWRLLRLDGAPATATATGVDLRAAQLTVVPGPEGQPYLLTAAGAEPQLVQTAADGKVTTFAGRRIYNLRPGAHLGAMYRGFGFPAIGLGQLQRLQIGICEGASTVTADGGVELHSQRGLWAIQLDPDDATGGTRLVGHGEVRIAQGEGKQRLLASGDDGFVLTRRFAIIDGVTTDFATLVLGSDDAAGTQRYELRQGELHVVGTGACRFDRQQPQPPDAPATLTVRLRSQQDDIHGSFGKDLGEVQGAREVDATLRDKEVVLLRVGGPRTKAVMVRGDETLSVSAPIVTQETPQVLRLDADAEQLAEVHRTIRDAAGTVIEDVVLQGPLLRIHRIDQRLAVLTAERKGDRRVHIAGYATPTGRGLVNFAVDANRVELVPFAVAPSAIDAHGNFLPAAARAAFARDLRQPWLFANGDLEFRATEAEVGTVTGQGESLALSQGSQSAMLVGDPDTGAMATMTRTESDGRVAKARGPWLRLWQQDGERVAAFTTFPGQRQAHLIHLPELELHSAPGGNQALAHLWAVCEGNLELLPDRVQFDGPVRVHGLRPDGSEDPTGIHVRAEHVDLTLDANGEVARIVASGGVVLDWNLLRARAQEVELDMKRHRCTVTDPDGAELWLPNGFYAKARQAEADYETFAVSLWQYSLQSQPPAKDPGQQK